MRSDRDFMRRAIGLLLMIVAVFHTAFDSFDVLTFLILAVFHVFLSIHIFSGFAGEG